MTKTEIRTLVKSQRKNLIHDFIVRAGKNITDAVLSCEAVKKAKSVMVFLSAFNEPRTGEIISFLLNNGTSVTVPISNTDNHTIIPVYFNSGSVLTSGAYGIKEPQNAEPANISDIDTAIIPALAFSKTGDRLGFGMGYYDRFLSEFAGTKIGLCYDFQIYDSLPTDPHDVKMDIIITEKRIYNDF